MGNVKLNKMFNNTWENMNDRLKNGPIITIKPPPGYIPPPNTKKPIPKRKYPYNKYHT